MTSEEVFRGAFVSLEVDEAFTEAVLTMWDGSCLCFRHRVGERWVKATGASLANQLLSLMSMFRLNGKHLDIQFQDGSRWEVWFRDQRQAR